MSHHHTPNHVRTYRQRFALTHEELAPLIGQCSASALSYFESGVRVPTLESALALQVLFDCSPREMFPGLYEAIEDTVMQRCAELYASLEGQTDVRSQAKRDWLDAIPGRGLPNDDIE